MGSLCRSIVIAGIDGCIVDIECHVSNNLPTIVIVGYAGRAVSEAKDRLRGAFANGRLTLPRKRITLNLAPADLPKAESGLDLAMAAAVLTYGRASPGITDDQLIIGELGLDSTTRPVRGIIGKLLAGQRHGFCSYFVPGANMEQARLVPGLRLHPVRNLTQLANHIDGTAPIRPVVTNDQTQDYTPDPVQDASVRLDDIAGQDGAKRAAIIAAAGGHNLLLSGPPGTGKSMLAKVLPGLLPPMNRQEMLETTQLSSLGNGDYGALRTGRPFRSPHHSASHGALVGGGSRLKPGEISLSHRGVLLLDELPEFDRSAIEALRQPLEDRCITVARAQETVQYPADFLLVATANPCPCGYYGYSIDRCSCQPYERKRYHAKLSGPIMDRLDLSADMHVVDHKRLLGTDVPGAEQRRAIESIGLAWDIQRHRYGTDQLRNGAVDNRLLRKTVRLERSAVMAMQDAAHRLGLSARAYMRSVKVARTIADLEASPVVTATHVAEALAYRPRPLS